MREPEERTRQWVLIALIPIWLALASSTLLLGLGVRKSHARLEALETHAKLCPEIVDRHNKECPFWSEEESP